MVLAGFANDGEDHACGSKVWHQHIHADEYSEGRARSFAIRRAGGLHGEGGRARAHGAQISRRSTRRDSRASTSRKRALVSSESSRKDFGEKRVFGKNI